MHAEDCRRVTRIAPVIPSVSSLSSRASAPCHPERQRGILRASLVAGYWQRNQDPSRLLGMTGAIRVTRRQSSACIRGPRFAFHGNNLKKGNHLGRRWAIPRQFPFQIGRLRDGLWKQSGHTLRRSARSARSVSPCGWPARGIRVPRFASPEQEPQLTREHAVNRSRQRLR